MKTSFSLMILCLIAFVPYAFCQSGPSSEQKGNQAMILYTITLNFSGSQMVRGDTLFIRNSLALEPIKTDVVNDAIGLRTGMTKSTSERRLDWYYITDITQGVGMGFDVNKEATKRNIKTFTAKSKDLGYGMTPEPFLPQGGYTPGDFSKVGDTVLNGQKCFVILANKTVPVNSDGRKDELLSTRMVINPQIKGQNYPFISELLAKQFGGAIVFVRSRLKSGLDISMKLEYETELSPKYTAIFDKYEGIYLSNIDLLNKLKN